MSIFFRVLLGTLCLAGVVTPGATHAFLVTDTQYVPVTSSAALYMITYQLGYQQYAITTPSFVHVSGQVSNHEGDTATVTFAGPRAVADAQGIILSDATVVNGLYHVPAGSVQNFTMLVAVTTSEAASLPESLAVSALPFTLTDWTGQAFVNGLSDGELKAFVVTGDQE